jgi:hypothetical protein
VPRHRELPVGRRLHPRPLALTRAAFELFMGTSRHPTRDSSCAFVFDKFIFVVIIYKTLQK